MSNHVTFEPWRLGKRMMVSHVTTRVNASSVHCTPPESLKVNWGELKEGSIPTKLPTSTPTTNTRHQHLQQNPSMTSSPSNKPSVSSAPSHYCTPNSGTYTTPKGPIPSHSSMHHYLINSSLSVFHSYIKVNLVRNRDYLRHFGMYSTHFKFLVRFYEGILTQLLARI